MDVLAMFKAKAGETAATAKAEAESRRAWLEEQAAKHLRGLHEASSIVSLHGGATHKVHCSATMRLLDTVIESERRLADFRVEIGTGRETVKLTVALEDGTPPTVLIAISKLHSPEDLVEYRFSTKFPQDAMQFLIESLAIYATDPHQPLPRNQDDVVRKSKKSRKGKGKKRVDVSGKISPGAENILRGSGRIDG